MLYGAVKSWQTEGHEDEGRDITLENDYPFGMCWEYSAEPTFRRQVTMDEWMHEAEKKTILLERGKNAEMWGGYLCKKHSRTRPLLFSYKVENILWSSGWLFSKMEYNMLVYFCPLIQKIPVYAGGKIVHYILHCQNLRQQILSALEATGTSRNHSASAKLIQFRGRT